MREILRIRDFIGLITLAPNLSPGKLFYHPTQPHRSKLFPSTQLLTHLVPWIICLPMSVMVNLHRQKAGLRSIFSRCMAGTTRDGVHNSHRTLQFAFADVQIDNFLKRSICSYTGLTKPACAVPIKAPFALDPSRRHLADCRTSTPFRTSSVRCYSEDLTHFPALQDSEIKNVFKDLMAASWDELPPAVIYDAKKALSKSVNGKKDHEVLANVFRAAEAVEDFTGILISLRMELDDSTGMSGENVKPLSKEFVDAMHIVFERYNNYLNAFGPEEEYLRKKVENELGTRMIHLKMRCSGLGSEWGKVTVLGTSGLSGSYVEQRAP